MLTFENIWVHSRCTATSSSSDNASNNVSNKLRKTVRPDPVLPADKRILINGVTGTLLSGQVTVLTGSSGSGKSVLLRVLAGLLPMSNGDVYLNNDDASSISASQSIHDTLPTEWRTQVALLAQHPQLLEGSVIDNLTMPYRLQAHQHLNFDIDWHIAQLERLQRSADFLQQDTYHLSGGERQLVNTLRLLQLNPQVLLLDEPTAALDIDTSAQLVKLLMNWLQLDAQRTLLWVTHDTQDIMPLANHHWHMQAGVLTEIF
ncbi:ABC transporter ATP-binding protein [Psychrobacter fozii]|uniref:ABC transporter ATP-binding protein n=1 Tax=Psychrobacter fozii TaxID=198480 RepID=UPI00191A3558|nr:ATP-binding cassette domain-containing protein [Psychrobacter fozii]